MVSTLDQQRRALLKLMRYLSERHWHAGWMRELEYDLWDAVLHGPQEYGFATIAQDDLAELSSLSRAVGGWFCWSDREPKGIQFISLKEWTPHYGRWATQRTQRRGEDPINLLLIAYTFEPQQFHHRLEEQVLADNHLDDEALRAAASAVPSRATESIKEALAAIRYSPDWLQSLDKAGNHRTPWYLLTLVGQLTEAPAPQKPLAIPVQVFEELLPLAGWMPDEVGILIYGQQLHTLVDSSDNHLFKASFSNIDQYGGGWLSLELSQSFLARLTQTQALFASPPVEVLDKFSSLAGLWRQTPHQMSQDVFVHTRNMLETAVTRKQALLLLLGERP